MIRFRDFKTISQKTWQSPQATPKKSILVDQSLELFHIAGHQIPAMRMAFS